MSARFEVALGARSHPVVIGRGLAPELVATLRELAPTRALVVSDANVAPLHLAPLTSALRQAGVSAAEPVVLTPGEASKSPATLLRLWDALHAAGLDRAGLVVALGGGVVGDVAGLAAATWLRGVRVLHLPTTLLAMVDSALGGKTAIDLQGAKNQVGAFHPPAALLCDLDRLATLPPRELRCGLAEAWKTALLAGDPLLGLLRARAAELAAGDPDALLPLVEGCLRHKAGVVAVDERDERGERALLNLGHTLGHALEAAWPALLHGEAVAIGVAFALGLSRQLGLCPAGFAADALALGRALGLELRPPARLELDALTGWLGRDKKRDRAGRPAWVLLRGPGRAEQRPVDDADLRAALAAFSAPRA